MKIHRFKRCPLSQKKFIRILWNFVSLFSTTMSFLSMIMVYMAPCYKKLLPLVYEKSSVETTSTLTWIVLILVQVLERPNRIMPSGVIALCEWQFPIYTNLAIAGASVSHWHISSFLYALDTLYTQCALNHLARIWKYSHFILFYRK